MSRFMMTLANAVANHVKEGKISIYKNSDVVYSSSKFQECLSRCSGVKFYDFERKDFDTFDEYDSALTELLKSKGADLVVLAGFMTILGHKVISAFENRIINIHPALIPSFCGEGFYKSFFVIFDIFRVIRFV